ncbi:MAG TPA: diguanylate cyclase [Thermoanaerobaculia bacterium]|nr:diguanylate cyclase [Thermoanaerobaculia bacterium]
MSTPHRRRQDGSTDPPHPIRVLIADDDPGYLVYLAALTRRLGLDTVTATDGGEAFAKLSAGEFDLLLSDYSMPRRNGLELIEAVRAEPRLQSVYAVMLTAHEEMSLKIEALTAGYDDFLQKNCTEVEVLAKVAAARRMLARQHALHDEMRAWQGIASRDELTGVFTRRFLFNEGERALYEKRAIGLVLFDLDDFKQINDTFGHLTGDRVLRDVGALFLSHTRQDDAIARFGGDEFMLLVHELSVDDIRAIAGRIADDIAAMQWLAGETTLSVHATTGVAASTLLINPTLDQILEAADRDLYANKWLRKHPSATKEELYQYQRERTADVVRMGEDFHANAPRRVPKESP